MDSETIGFSPEELDEGVRDLVVWLDVLGFVTSDSGDGSKADVMDCAVPFPMISIRVEKGDNPMVKVEYLSALLRSRGVDFSREGVKVELSYDPYDQIGMLIITGVLSVDVDMTNRGEPQ